MHKPTVALTRCHDYSPEAVQMAVDRVLDDIGGMGSIVSPGKSVLLKPNMLTDREPECAVTTHPEIVRALIRTVRKHGGRPVVADSPANVTKIERVWERTGFRSLCEQENVPLINLEKSGSTVVSVGSVSFTVAQPVLDADVLISIPKVKTHMLTIFTGAVKNLYGTIPGFQKTTLHKLYPKPADFGKLLAVIYERLKPHLAVADAIVGMDGEGPSGGNPVKLGLVAASRDSVALDAVFCHLLQINIRAVPYFRPLAKAALGETDWTRINVVGARMDEGSPVKFRVPSSLPGRLIAGPLLQLFQPLLWIRPYFVDRCVSCGRCVKACPVNALRIENKSRPILDAGKCIGCCCCHEVCPEQAVEMRLSPFLSFIRRGRLP
jgi:uncharacterized protein (DUF362 family)/NAD-dependent dihydropyrimidine dehydrogenase PreA subunit